MFASFTTTAGGKKKKKSSVHVVTTSFAAEVVSPRLKPPPQLKNTTKYRVRLGYNDLAKKQIFSQKFVKSSCLKLSSVALSKQVEVQRKVVPHNCCSEYNPHRTNLSSAVAAAVLYVWVYFANSFSIIPSFNSPFRRSPSVLPTSVC